jgi:hypothetical protein
MDDIFNRFFAEPIPAEEQIIRRPMMPRQNSFSCEACLEFYDLPNRTHGCKCYRGCGSMIRDKADQCLCEVRMAAVAAAAAVAAPVGAVEKK